VGDDRRTQTGTGSPRHPCHRRAVAYMDTDMAAFAPADQKTDPAIVAELALDGLLAGEPEVLADDLTRAT
jgi:hypothetical protein